MPQPCREENDKVVYNVDGNLLGLKIRLCPAWPHAHAGKVPQHACKCVRINNAQRNPLMFLLVLRMQDFLERPQFVLCQQELQKPCAVELQMAKIGAEESRMGCLDFCLRIGLCCSFASKCC